MENHFLPAGLRGRAFFGEGNRMDDLISRQAAIAALGTITMYKGMIPFNTAMERIKRMPSAELGTNLAEVGTDCINRQAAIETFKDCAVNGVGIDGIVDALNQLPPIQPDKNKVSNLLYHIYSIQSPHLDMSGVIAKKYYCEELWKELFGKESELPGWMT